LRTIYGLTKEKDDSVTEPEAQAQKILSRHKIKSSDDLSRTIKKKTREMHRLAGKLEFEKAAEIRDELRNLEAMFIVFADEV